MLSTNAPPWIQPHGPSFVLRTAHPEVPPRVDYRLTPLGSEVAAHVATLADWIEANLPRVLRMRQARG